MGGVKWGLGALLLWGTTHLARAAIFEFYELKELRHCIKIVKKDVDDLEISCPLDRFVSQARDANYSEPGKRFLVARLLVKALFSRHQSDLFKNKAETPKEEAQTLFPDLPRSRKNYLQYFFPESENYSLPVLAPSKEATFISQSKSLVDEIMFWLEPLRIESSDERGFLKAETNHLLFWTYGLGLRFDSLASLMEQEHKELLKHSDFEQLYLSQVSQWIRTFGALPLRTWYANRIRSKIGSPGGSLNDTKWNYWIDYLRLMDRPIPSEQQGEVLGHLRWLWIISPETKRHSEIVKLGEELGFHKELENWTLESLTWEEYSWRVQALIRNLNARAAEQLMNRILTDKAELPKNKDELWEALQMHIRIYKILDERTKISETINSYEKKFNFFAAPTERGEVFRHFERIYQMGIQFWTLEENEAALKLFSQIEASKSKEARSIQLKVAYVRARMNENKDTENLKKTFKLDLREDQKLELGWRTFFKLIEGNPKQVGEGLKFLEINTPLFKRLGEYPIKISFWKALTLSKLKREKEALKILISNFKEEPYTYYGLTSALLHNEMTGKFPPGWELGAKRVNESFSEHNYLNADGFPNKEREKLISRALVLAKARDIDRALAVLREVTQVRPWRTIASSSEQESKMRDTARLFVALGNKRSAMNLMASLLADNPEDLSQEDWEFIFPRLFENEIRERAKSRNVDPWIISSVIRQESSFDPRARSPVDALGLMQLLPTTAEKEAKLLGKKDFKVESLFEPSVAIELGVHHLTRLLANYGQSYICAFAAYNAGTPPLKVWLGNHGNGQSLTFIERIPYKETRDYVKKLLRNYVMYRRLYEREIPEMNKIFAMPSKVTGAKVSANEDPNRVAQE